MERSRKGSFLNVGALSDGSHSGLPQRWRSPRAGDMDHCDLPRRWRYLHASDLYAPATWIPFGTLPQRWRSLHASDLNAPATWIPFGTLHASDRDPIRAPSSTLALSARQRSGRSDLFQAGWGQEPRLAEPASFFRSCC